MTTINNDYDFITYEKTTWDILKLYHRKEVANVRFLRSADVDEKYKYHLANLKIPLAEQIYNMLDNCDYALQPNNFGYNVSDEIIHMCIWWKKYNEATYGNILDSTGNKHIKQILERDSEKYGIQNIKWKELENYIYFENAPSNKSIPEIKHIHVFIKI